jgi:hypothetical protein
MAWFKRREQTAPAARAPEHAVIIRYRLTGEDYGTEEEREAVFALENRIAGLVDAAGVGELDGNEFGGGEAVVYCYGPDADALFAAIEDQVRAFPARPASVTLRYGEAADPTAVEQRIDL